MDCQVEPAVAPGLRFHTNAVPWFTRLASLPFSPTNITHCLDLRETFSTILNTSESGRNSFEYGRVTHDSADVEARDFPQSSAYSLHSPERHGQFVKSTADDRQGLVDQRWGGRPLQAPGNATAQGGRNPFQLPVRNPPADFMNNAPPRQDLSSYDNQALGTPVEGLVPQPGDIMITFNSKRCRPPVQGNPGGYVTLFKDHNFMERTYEQSLVIDRDARNYFGNNDLLLRFGKFLPGWMWAYQNPVELFCFSSNDLPGVPNLNLLPPCWFIAARVIPRTLVPPSMSYDPEWQQVNRQQEDPAATMVRNQAERLWLRREDERLMMASHGGRSTTAELRPYRNDQRHPTQGFAPRIGDLILRYDGQTTLLIWWYTGFEPRNNDFLIRAGFQRGGRDMGIDPPGNLVSASGHVLTVAAVELYQWEQRVGPEDVMTWWVFLGRDKQYYGPVPYERDTTNRDPIPFWG